MRAISAAILLVLSGHVATEEALRPLLIVPSVASI